MAGKAKGLKRVLIYLGCCAVLAFALAIALALAGAAPAAVAHYAETRKLAFGVAIDNTGAIARSFGDVDATPTTFVIDKRGAIVQRIVGTPDFAALGERIEALLAAPA